MAYDPNNIFAKILRGEIPCKKVYEDDFALAFHDIAPDAPVHVLVIPKIDCISFDDFVQTASAEFIRGYFCAVQKVAADLRLQKSGYRIVTNHGDDALQTVKHFHVHILGGAKLGGLVAAH